MHNYENCVECLFSASLFPSMYHMHALVALAVADWLATFDHSAFTIQQLARRPVHKQVSYTASSSSIVWMLFECKKKNTHLILKGKTGTCIGSQPYVTFFCISASLTGAALLYAQKTLKCAEVCPGVMLYRVAGIALYQEMPLNWDNTKRNICCIFIFVLVNFLAVVLYWSLLYCVLYSCTILKYTEGFCLYW